MRCPVILLFITKQAKVLFDFLVLTLYFAVTLWIVGSSKASLNTKCRGDRLTQTQGSS
jgi:hypothetical protein